MEDKSCWTCSHAKRFCATDGEWMDVCTAQEADDQEEGFFLVPVVDKDLFDAELCLDYSTSLL